MARRLQEDISRGGSNADGRDQPLFREREEKLRQSARAQHLREECARREQAKKEQEDLKKRQKAQRDYKKGMDEFTISRASRNRSKREADHDKAVGRNFNDRKKIWTRGRPRSTPTLAPTSSS